MHSVHDEPCCDESGGGRPCAAARACGVLVALVLSSSLGGCKPPCRRPPSAAPPLATDAAPPSPPAPPPFDAAVPSCEEALRGAHEETPCRAVGTYGVHAFTTKGGGLILDVWPVVFLADGRPILLESLWHKETRPTPETIARLEGRRVEVVGVLQREPPKRPELGGQNFSMPCLSPIHALRVLEDTGTN